MSTRTRRALIVGGSMSGLFAALYLRQCGWQVDIFERSPMPLTGRGAGIMTHPEMRRALAELGIDASRDYGVPIVQRLVLGAPMTRCPINRRPGSIPGRSSSGMAAASRKA